MITRRVISLPFLAAGFLFTAAPAGAQTPVIQASTQERQPAMPALTEEQRGDLFMARKMFREAIATYKKAPETAMTLNKIGIAWHNLGELDLARKSYEKATKRDKTYAEAINNAGTVFYAQKRYGPAIKRYKKALKLAPDKAAFWSNLGTAYYSQRKYPLMMQAYTTAMTLDPGIFEHRGVMGTEVQDLTVSDRGRYHFEIARLYARMGNESMALEYLRHSFEEGFKDKDKIKKSPEFASMLEKPEFIALMALDPRVL